MHNKTIALEVKIKFIILLILPLFLFSCWTTENKEPQEIISNSGAEINIAEDIDSGASVNISNSWANIEVSASWVEINSNSGEISVSDWNKSNIKVAENKINVATENNVKVEVNSWVDLNSAEISKETQETLQDIDKLLNSIN